MIRSGVEHRSPGRLANALLIRPMAADQNIYITRVNKKHNTMILVMDGCLSQYLHGKAPSTPSLEALKNAFLVPVPENHK